jgi:hypothetical protein
MVTSSIGRRAQRPPPSSSSDELDRLRGVREPLPVPVRARLQAHHADRAGLDAARTTAAFAGGGLDLCPGQRVQSMQQVGLVGLPVLAQVQVETEGGELGGFRTVLANLDRGCVLVTADACIPGAVMPITCASGWALLVDGAPLAWSNTDIRYGS